MAPLLETRELSHLFPGGAAGLRGVTLQIPPGLLAVLTGRNGSGKTTLLRHFNGLLRPTGGGVFLDGVPVNENLVENRQKIGLVFQNPDSQIVGETVWDDAAFGPENLGLGHREIRRRVEEALESVGLADKADLRPHILSGGEKRRLALAGVLAAGAEILLLDEPFNSLDFPGVRQVLEQVVRLHSEGKTVVIATHDLEKVYVHAQRLLIMEGGRLVGDGPPEELVEELEEYGVRRPCGLRPDRGMESWLK